MFLREKRVGAHSYLQIVENHREGKSVKQRVIANLGHSEELIDSGKLDNLARSILKRTKTVRLFDANKNREVF
jgi:S-adenosylhomocysteine hydrolase